MDAGLFGYYPLVDRAKGTYMQIVYMKLVKSSTDFEPTISAMVLRRLIKPLVDWALMESAPGDTVEEPPTVDSSPDAIWAITDSILESSGLKEKYRSPAEVWSFLLDSKAEEIVV